MEFRFLEVNKNDKELLEKVFAFRYKVITTTEIFKEYVDENKISNNEECDKYDPYSIHFVAINNKNEIIATVRLIHNSPIGYPTENCMKFDKSQFDRDKLGEMSRIFVDEIYRSIQNTKQIFYNLNKLLYLKMKRLGIEYTYGALEPRFVRLLRMNKMKYEPLAEKQLHGTMGLRYPCILYTDRLGLDNKEFIELWEQTAHE